MSTVVEITSERRILIESSPRYELTATTTNPPALTIDPVGVPGPPGPPGPAGGEHYIYDRAGVPAATWTVSHNLGRFPHVTVLADDGTEVTSDVVHADLNTTVITFAAPFSGRAIIG